MFIFRWLKINHDTHEFILDSGTVANSSDVNRALAAPGDHKPVLGGALVQPEGVFRGSLWFIFFRVASVYTNRHFVTLAICNTRSFVSSMFGKVCIW